MTPTLGPGAPRVWGSRRGFDSRTPLTASLGPQSPSLRSSSTSTSLPSSFPTASPGRTSPASSADKRSTPFVTEDIPALTFLQRLSRHCYEDPSVPSEPRGLVRIHRQLVRAGGLPEGTDFNSETTQRGLTDRQREIAQALTERDSSLPPGMFRPAEFDALRALIVQRDAVRGVNEDTPGQIEH